jgi:hypothetical protein
MDMGEKREGWAGVITRWGRSRAVSPVGWVERSDTSSMPERVAMGIASLHPSYGHNFALSRRIASEVCLVTSRPLVRGRREDRVLAAPAVSRAICANKTAHEHTGQREHSGLPCAMALRLTSCSSRRTALLPPSPPRSFASLGLSASTAAPEPHDFAVRLSHTRQSQLSRPSHLTARS